MDLWGTHTSGLETSLHFKPGCHEVLCIDMGGIPLSMRTQMSPGTSTHSHDGDEVPRTPPEEEACCFPYLMHVVADKTHGCPSLGSILY